MTPIGSQLNLPLFPVMLVGSLPRPRWLVQVLRDRNQGNVPDVEWQQLAEHAIREAVEIQRSIGLDILTDGEQSRENAFTFFETHVTGLRASELSSVVAQAPGLLDELSARDVPLASLKHLSRGDTVSLKPNTPGLTDIAGFEKVGSPPLPFKVALPGPYTLSRSASMQEHGSLSEAEQDGLAAEIVQLLRTEIIRLRDAGVAFVQLDEPAVMATSLAADTSETFHNVLLPASRGRDAELHRATELLNAVTSGVTGISTALHTCRGSWTRRESALISGDYASLVTFFNSLQLDILVMETASARAGSLDWLRDIDDHFSVGLGVVDPKSDAVESAETIVEHVTEAMRHIPAQRLLLNPDCGFSTYAERNLNTMETVIAKLESIVTAAKQLRQRLQE